MAYTLIKCDSLEKFWKLVDPTNPLGMYFPQDLCDRILYRGQSDSEWGLAPSSLRGYKNFEMLPISEFRKSIIEEFELLKRFFNSSSVRAQIPKGIGHIDLQDDFVNIDSEVFFNDLENLLHWPLKKYEPLSAYAQHMSTNTSFLDWTSYSYVAVFFASIGHMIESVNLNKSKEIAIWIYLNKGGNPSRVKVKKPLSDEPNINAQYGSFISIHQEIKDVNIIEFQTLESLSNESDLYKITIDKKYYPLILKYCHNHFIDLASLHPSDKSLASKSIEYELNWRNILGKSLRKEIFLDQTADIEVLNE